jgi:hypothetical protein
MMRSKSTLIIPQPKRGCQNHPGGQESWRPPIKWKWMW